MNVLETDDTISRMNCRVCGGPLHCKDETLACEHCGTTFENFDDAIGDPWDEPNEDEPQALDFGK